MILDKASIEVLSEIRALSVETIAVPKALVADGIPLGGMGHGSCPSSLASCRLGLAVSHGRRERYPYLPCARRARDDDVGTLERDPLTWDRDSALAFGLSTISSETGVRFFRIML